MSASESEQFWEPLYAQRSAPAAPPRPNAVLVDLIDEFGPPTGHALDLGCGHGGDALWLAARGWQVTAVDVAATAVERVAALARAGGLADRVRATRHDLSRSLPTETFDLIYACYFHTPVDIDRDGVLRRAAELMRVGALLIVVDHASIAPWSWSQEEHHFPTPAETYAAIGLDQDWAMVLTTARNREATGPDGTTTATVTDNIIVAQRLREQPFSARAERENSERLGTDDRHGLGL